MNLLKHEFEVISQVSFECQIQGERVKNLNSNTKIGQNIFLGRTISICTNSIGIYDN